MKSDKAIALMVSGAVQSISMAGMGYRHTRLAPYARRSSLLDPPLRRGHRT